MSSGNPMTFWVLTSHSHFHQPQVSVNFLAQPPSPPSTKPRQPHRSAVLSELSLCGPAQSSFPCCFQQWILFPSLLLTPHFSAFLPFQPELACYCVWSRWLPPPSSQGRQRAQALLLHCPPHWCGLLKKTSLALLNTPGWHSGSLAVCWGTACLVRSVIFSNLNFWIVIFSLSETWPGSLLCPAGKPSMTNFNFLFQNSKSP